MLSTLRRAIFSTPGLKQYGQLVEYAQRKVTIRNVKKSSLIHEKPSTDYIKKCKQGNCYLYLPWIKALTNKLIETIDQSDTIRFIPLTVFADSHNLTNRGRINYFAKYCHQDLVQILSNWLEPVAKDIKGFVFTFDYTLLQREIIKLCAKLNILTILIPHESVFLNRNKYYYYPLTEVNSPRCDYVLCWGQLQKDIFVSRGYPEERIKIVGAPKFDRHYHFHAKLSREEFCTQAKLNPKQKIILYAAQTLDFQVNQKKALQLQQSLIKQLIHYATKNQCGFVLRCPPTQVQILSTSVVKEMHTAGFFIDGLDSHYCFEVEEAIYHAEVLVSINSTMLFEAVLMGTPSISVKYFDFEEYWKEAGIPYAHDKTELIHLLNECLRPEKSKVVKLTEWAKLSFTPKEFDGQASARIMNFLDSPHQLTKLPSAIASIINDDLPGLDMVYCPKPIKSLTHLVSLINAKKIVTNQDKWLIPRVDCIVQSEPLPSTSMFINAPSIYITHGLIGTTEPWLSIIVDDVACYDVASQTTRLQQLLNSPQELTPEQENYATQCMEKMLTKKIAHNYQPATQSNRIGRAGCKKILLLDQYHEDPTVCNGLANETHFHQLIADAISNYPDYDILIYLPMNPLLKNQQSYYNKDFLAPYLKRHQYLFTLTPLHNIYDLCAQVERVFTVTSSLGFAALIAGKNVACYGLPFFANRGLTDDKITLHTRTRKRRVIDIFYFTYIALSRYYSPQLQRKCQLDEFIDHYF